MNGLSRRDMVFSGGALLGLSACGNGVGGNRGAQLDARVDATRDFLASRYPGTVDLMNKAAGVLYMPLMTEAGFVFGGAYGRGALRINNVTVDYYSATQASVGFQAGARQYAQVLVFQTDKALGDFRAAPGWVAGAGAFYALPENGLSFGADTVTYNHPILAMIFGETGIMAGAAIEGTKYTRIIPSALGTR